MKVVNKIFISCVLISVFVLALMIVGKDYPTNKSFYVQAEECNNDCGECISCVCFISEEGSFSLESPSLYTLNPRGLVLGKTIKRNDSFSFQWGQRSNQLIGSIADKFKEWLEAVFK